MSITDCIFYTLAFTYTWDEFSNHTSSSGAYNSLEAIHDTIHDLVGGGGHMGDPGYAGRMTPDSAICADLTLTRRLRSHILLTSLQCR